LRPRDTAAARPGFDSRGVPSVQPDDTSKGVAMNPRGSIVCPSRPIDIGNGCVLTGRKPGIVVYVKAGSGRLYREFIRFCDRAGIDTKPVENADADRPTAFECVGSLESLDRLAGHPSVSRWHYILSVRPPLAAVGSGPEKPRQATGTVFGTPATVRATAEAIARDRSKNAIAQRKTGNLC
jgi:hypothetical protein